MKYPKRSQYKYAKSRYGSETGLNARQGYAAEETLLAGFLKMQSTPGGNRPAGNQAVSAHMLISLSKLL